jgi:hypothetical protein
MRERERERERKWCDYFDDDDDEIFDRILKLQNLEASKLCLFPRWTDII